MKKDRLDSITFQDRMKTDAQIYNYAKEVEEVPNEYMDMSVYERLIGKEIICRELEEKGGTTSWLDTDEKWQKNIRKMVCFGKEQIRSRLISEVFSFSIIYIYIIISSFITKYVADYKLNKEMSNEELSQHVLALLELLIDRVKRDKDHQYLQEEYGFSKEQAFVLVPSQRTGQYKSQVISKEGGSEVGEVNLCQVSNLIPEGEMIKKTAQHIMRD
ncbi:hypothetical protein C1645_742868 [Glomus cerebriforme]|uniref:Uncharacterized protein n=1 Tax=Glomus cerebriforme TaxID=658196 RepID=A0A397SDX8_9GLOM|nr:hypothetical protein C1645_742868 [Glomus cerebriforme]